jgi:hypothetical protein
MLESVASSDLLNAPSSVLKSRQGKLDDLAETHLLRKYRGEGPELVGVLPRLSLLPELQ